MPDALNSRLFHKLRHTSIRDLARGRITGRLDVRSRIGAANLPAGIDELIARIVRRTRLWPVERVDVADELISHFAAGIAAGRSPEELIAAFGDERHAAKLIRRAKRRNRALAWHVWAYFGWLLRAVIVFYLCLAAFFFAGKPSPSIDYVAQLNARIESVPEQNRAWPLYHQAILAMQSGVKLEEDAEGNIWNAKPGDSQWDNLGTYIRGHADAIALARQASHEPALGFVLKSNESNNSYGPFKSTKTGSPVPEFGAAICAYNAPMEELQLLASAMMADSRIALNEGDGNRFESDFNFLRDLARQLRNQSVVFLQGAALRIDTESLAQVNAAVAQGATTLDDSMLQRIAHRLAREQFASDLLNFRDERAHFYDLVQRIYTDNGHGDGRLTADAAGGYQIEILNLRESKESNHIMLSARIAQRETALVLLSSRADIVRAYDNLIDRFEADLCQPIYLCDSDRIANQMMEWKGSELTRLRYLPLITFQPSLRGLRESAERYLGERDGVLAGIALELYRRQHGGWPESLEKLVPALLTGVPIDRITGQPVHYRIVNGKPLVYSVGADHDDDSGRPPARDTAAVWPSHNDTAPDGDWILFRKRS